jgi:hypothetical protein
MMEREDDAARAQMDIVSDGGERGGGDGRVRIEVAEGMEVAFRSPDGGEAMRVSEARAIEEQAIAVSGRRVAVTIGVGGRVRGEVEEAEVEMMRSD